MGQGDVRRSRRGPGVIKIQVIRQKSCAGGITQLLLRNYSFLYNNEFPQADKPSGVSYEADCAQKGMRP